MKQQVYKISLSLSLINYESTIISNICILSSIERRQQTYGPSAAIIYIIIITFFLDVLLPHKNPTTPIQKYSISMRSHINKVPQLSYICHTSYMAYRNRYKYSYTDKINEQMCNSLKSDTILTVPQYMQDYLEEAIVAELSEFVFLQIKIWFHWCHFGCRRCRQLQMRRGQHLAAGISSAYVSMISLQVFDMIPQGGGFAGVMYMILIGRFDNFPGYQLCFSQCDQTSERGKKLRMTLQMQLMGYASGGNGIDKASLDVFLGVDGVSIFNGQVNSREGRYVKIGTGS
uniref:Uncharacterized protein n=1 Tax=Spironucleus salmonicida TaxID=348837 RepID=V6LGN9_9EUKA|eukprot:EST42871.1 Hypothetical protein SS50377_17492 [Spironucleus salmonicida]